jgi:hypothetical protein
VARSKPSTKSPIYQLKVTLADIRPPIWRRIQVPGNTPLPLLHLMLQAAMGWCNCHLHAFTINEVDYGAADPEFDSGMENETRIRLDKVIPAAKMRFSYTYDFGDGWNHKILVEKILPPNPGVQYPVCLAGARACPPEDCGGPWGYGDFLRAINDPNHEEHKQLLEWVGGSFDPEAFDLDGVDGRLKNFKLIDPLGI